MTQRRIRGTLEVRKTRVVVVRSPQDPVLQRCPVCRRKVEMVIPEEAARRCQVSPRTMYRWLESGRVHFVELSDAEVLVCLNSI
jgi:hypothetical protein